jgi:pyruvate/2-oxoglutarate dehydrogenase complex dihydrolipoamide dehydrogenase (E3) component
VVRPARWMCRVASISPRPVLPVLESSNETRKREDRRVHGDLVFPRDEHDAQLVSHVRPEGWRNPHPAPIYDLVVIGGGTAGLVSAVGAAALGARVALVERARLGGDCLNTGCVPSKALLRAARAVHEARSSQSVGVNMRAEVDFSAVMRSVRARRAELAHHDSAARLSLAGVDVFFGDAAFRDARTLTVGDDALPFRRAVIATGGRPCVPAIPGLADVSFLTSESVFSLTVQPTRLVVIGGGPVGCELAQAFALLGTTVTLAEAGPRVLPHEDAEASEILQRSLAEDGVHIMTATTLREIAARPTSGGATARFNGGEIDADAVLVATGRSPNLEGLNLESAGVDHDGQGVHVDDWLRTSNPRIYAAGDVCSRFNFTHAADAMARIVVQNALFPLRRRVSALVIPWAIYTFPEVAHVGLSPIEAIKAGVEPITIPLADVDRAVIDEDTEGFFRVSHHRGRIVAATIVAPRAGELIGYVASMMRRRATLAELSSEIFPYPTLAEALRKAGDSYRRQQLTPRVRALLRRYLALVRRF